MRWAVCISLARVWQKKPLPNNDFRKRALISPPDSPMLRSPMDEAEPTEAPQGELVIRTIAMPADTNPSGDIFGGWIMSQMDLGSGILAAKVAKTRVVTVAIESMSFLRPVHVGDRVA